MERLSSSFKSKTSEIYGQVLVGDHGGSDWTVHQARRYGLCTPPSDISMDFALQSVA